MVGVFIFLDGRCIENHRSFIKCCMIGPEFGRRFSAEVLLLLEDVSCYCDVLGRQAARDGLFFHLHLCHEGTGF